MAKNPLSRSEWFIAVVVYLLLLVLASVLSPSAEDSNKLSGRGLQLVTIYEVVASLIVMFAAAFGCAFGRRFSQGRSIPWITTVGFSLPLGLVISFQLENAGYPRLHREIAIVIIVTCGLLVIPPQRPKQ